MDKDEVLLRSVLDELKNVRGPDSTGWYTACCPFHNDQKHPNLRLTSRGFRCMTCGTKGNLRVLAERLGLPSHSSFDARINATYDYRDEKGGLLFQVVRLRDPKDFLQRRPVGNDDSDDNDGISGWIWNLEGVRRVLYRLPELLAADPEQPVFVVEGEKDCDTLAALGLIATTNPGGAGKWSPEYAEHLRGRIVIIIPDNDAPGREHARQVARSLAGIDAETKILDIPDLPPKGDVSDWLASGGSKGLLVQLAASAGSPSESEGGVEVESPSSEAREVSAPEDGRRTAAERLVELALVSEALLFHDQRGDPYVAFSQKGRRQVWPLRSSAAKHWLSYLAWQSQRKAASSETLKTALGILEATARFDGEQHNLEVRVAWHEGAIWYDLGDWRAVRVSAKGWEVVDKPPLLFRHFGHQKAQAEPIPGGHLHSFLRLVNLPDWRQQLLLLVYLVVALVAHIPRPILIARGDHGSGKSTLFGFVRDLLDPSHLCRQSAPDSIREFVQAASHNLCFFLDNLSHLPDWMSDAFCRLCTGDGFSKRQLYTDDDDVIYAMRGLGGFNGINLVASRPDLLDRALILTLEAIPDADRKLDAEYQAEFGSLRPSLMGALFDALARTMAAIDTVHLDALPRMADFARWGCAASRALGYTEREFVDAFGANIREQNKTKLEDSVVAQAVLQLMKEVCTWRDTPAATLERLTTVAQDLHIDTRERTWPKSPSALTRRLNEIRPNLLREGVAVETGDRSGEARTITFKCLGNAVIAVSEARMPSQAQQMPSPAVIKNRIAVIDSEPDNVAHNANDGILATSEAKVTVGSVWEEEVP